MKLFKLYEQVEQEQSKEPKMVTLTPVDKKFLKLMQRKEIDNGDGEEIWEFLTDTLSIDDQQLAIRLSYLYMEDLIDEDEGETYDDLEKVNIDIEGINNSFDDRILALSSHLGVPPFLIEEERYKHYDLETYTVDGDEYAVGDEDEMDKAMLVYAQNRLEEGLNSFDEWWLENYLEPRDYDIEQFAEDEAHYRVSDMDDDAILDEAGYETPSDYEEYKEIKESELEEKESEKEELEEELIDLDSDEDAERMEELEFDIDYLESEISELQEEISELEDKIEDPGLDEAREELIERYTENTMDEIRDQGVSYFTSNLGLDYQDAVNGYFDFDEEGALNDLATEHGYEPICTKNGDYYEEWVDGDLYFILQVN